MRERTYRFPKRSFGTIVILVIILVLIYMGGRAIYEKLRTKKITAQIVGKAQDSPIGGPNKVIPASSSSKIDGLTVYTISAKEISSTINFDTQKQPDDQSAACNGYPHTVIDQPTDEYRVYVCYFYLKPSDTCYTTKAETDPHPCPDRSTIGMKSIKIPYITRKADGQSSVTKSDSQLILAIDIPGSNTNPSKWWATDIVDSTSSLYSSIIATRPQRTIAQGTLYSVFDSTRACPALDPCVASALPEKYIKTKSGTIYHILNYEDTKLLAIGK
jgi:hypothetical protein